MEHFRIIRFKNKYRQSKLKHSDDGLTNVIAVVFVIAIIMTLIIGPYLTITVPDKIKGNEAAHIKEVKESFSELRANIDDQLTKETFIHNTRIKLGTDDENLLVTGGTGVLYFDSTEPVVSISSFYDDQSIYARGSGQIRYRTRNQYFTDSSLIYETTGVIRSQGTKARMQINPDFEIDRQFLVRTLGLDAEFAMLRLADTSLRFIYLSNTEDSNITFNKARITWSGGNASAVTNINIDGGAAEWIGSETSNTLINFISSYYLTKKTVIVNVTFNSDVTDTSVRVELITSTNTVISATYPVTEVDTVANTYDLIYPTAQSVKNIAFKNNGPGSVTIEQIGVTWTGNASIFQVEIPSHGDVVWDVPSPGLHSPAFITLTKDSMFATGESARINLFFNGKISGKDLSIKFFTENSTNKAFAQYPLSLNRTFINASFSTLTLICDNTNIEGKSSQMIKTTHISSEENRYIWDSGEKVVFNITTSYPEAWIEYLNNTLTYNTNLIWDIDGIGAYNGDYYLTMTRVTDELTNINLVLDSIYRLDCLIGVISVELG
jgi:hypothetical protein